MRHFLSVCAVIAGIGLLALTPAGQAAEADKDVHKIVYLSDDGPVLIALRLSVDGKPLRAAHRALMDKLFDYLDRDGDGVLSRTEAAAAPAVAVLSSGRGPLFPRVAPGQPSFNPTRGGEVTRAQLAAYFRQNGLAPLQIPAMQMQLTQVRRVQGVESFSAEQLTDRLFHMLDTDHDGALSRKELEAAEQVLGKLDVDEDEMITTAELMGEAGGADPYALLAVRQVRPVNSLNHLLHVVADGDKDEALAWALMQRYGKPGALAVPAARLRLSKEATALLDRDGDGELSVAELARLGQKPADMTVTVRLGPRADQTMITLNDRKSLPAGMKAEVNFQGVILHMGKGRLELVLGQEPNFAAQIDVRSQYKAIFRRLDTNNDGFVDRMEARMAPQFREFFDLMDRAGAGKVSEKEMLAYLDEMDKLQKMVNKSCVSLAISQQGQGLFELLDANHDGKLSIRELRKAYQVLASLAEGRDKLARSDVPRHNRVSLAMGPNAGQDPLGRVPPPIVRQGMRVGVLAPTLRGPVWFLKMDRNRDGDVSRKEFLGTDEQFKAIDTDGDGLISLEEAQAFDKRKPAREQPGRRERGGNTRRGED